MFYGVGKVSGILLQKKRYFLLLEGGAFRSRHRFNKKKIEVSLRTKSEAKAARSAVLGVVFN